jgi:septum formation protein
MNFKRPLILASNSPRRQYLMREAGFEFTVQPSNADESFPTSMPVQFVPSYLAEKKAKAMMSQLKNEIVITADTVVILGSDILNKPQGPADAFEMLSRLSGRVHTVITGVCLLDKSKSEIFDDRTKVSFKKLSKEEIDYYVSTYKPYDKAGAYGAQDWIGMVAIEKIVGSYFNVMGLPIHKVYTRLHAF